MDLTAAPYTTEDWRHCPDAGPVTMQLSLPARQLQVRGAGHRGRCLRVPCRSGAGGGILVLVRHILSRGGGGVHNTVLLL